MCSGFRANDDAAASILVELKDIVFLAFVARSLWQIPNNYSDVCHSRVV